jgi:hypothetical protein
MWVYCPFRAINIYDEEIAEILSAFFNDWDHTC